MPGSPHAHLDGTTLALVAGALAVVVALVQTLRLWWRSFSRRRTLRQRARHAATGEVRAELLLAERGYEVEARQVAGQVSLTVDDRPVTAGVRADLVVRRGGRRWVAEVKTGSLAPSITHPATRRQLLEYSLAFETAGMLLVDVDAGRVEEVRFRLPVARTPIATRLAWLATGLAAGGLAAWLAH